MVLILKGVFIVDLAGGAVTGNLPVMMKREMLIKFVQVSLINLI
jgi:hypothetical protein